MARETPAILPAFVSIARRPIRAPWAGAAAAIVLLASAGCGARGLPLERHASLATASEGRAELLSGVASGWEAVRRDNALAVGAGHDRPVVNRYEIETRSHQRTVNGRVLEYSRTEVETLKRGFR
jgi:hypothetical protein